jgi:hypothetical protein
VSEQAHPPDLDGTFEADGRVTLFGFDSTPARARLRPRSKAWRVSGLIRIVAVTLVVAPMVTLIPPHAPWLLGVLGGGAYLASRRWKERFTLESLEGTCPKCGTALQVTPGRLRDPHGLSCDSCHNDVELRVPAEALAAHGGVTD